MRPLVWTSFFSLVAGTAAVAAPNDFQIYQLGCPSAATCAGLGVTQSVGQANDAAFRAFTREIAAAITSIDLMPPSTLGDNGFAMNAEISVANLRPNSTFVMPTASAFQSPLLLPSIHVRKGLPWSFELGSRFAWLNQSSMAAATLEAKWALNEGFAYLPDVSVRGYGTRLINAREFDLTVTGFDVAVGKRFAIGGMITLTPYGGWNLVMTAAEANSVDFQPSRTQASAIATPTAQLTNSGVFSDVNLGENMHSRFYGGVRFVGGVVQLGAEISYSHLGSFGYTDAATNATVSVAMPDLWAFNGTVGLAF